MKDWFKARKIWGAAILSLSDTEAGRLMKAVWSYILTGEKQELSGAERGAYAMILMTLEQDEQADAEISKKRAIYGSKGGKQTQAKPSKSKQMQAKALQESTPLPPLSPPSLLPPTPPIIIPPIIPQNPPKDFERERENAREDMPFGLTEEDVHETLKRNAAIEKAALSSGLPMSEATLLEACELARQYGLDKLLAAIKDTAVNAQRPTWKFVRRMLDGYRGNNRQDRRAPRTEYTHLEYTSV